MIAGLLVSTQAARKADMNRIKSLLVLIACSVSVFTTTSSAQAPAHPKHFRPANLRPQPLPRTSGDVAIVNSASFLPGVSPGGLATIFGHDLTDVSGSVIAGTNPLPTGLS